MPNYIVILKIIVQLNDIFNELIKILKVEKISGRTLEKSIEPDEITKDALANKIRFYFKFVVVDNEETRCQFNHKQDEFISDILDAIFS